MWADRRQRNELNSSTTLCPAPSMRSALSSARDTWRGAGLWHMQHGLPRAW
ncbi:hypothetical protein CSC36_6596 [Pseudomonas aeruginosa]|nr:hypothetical protein CSC36_6596 [Pseudomonas aeruginosa]